MFSETKRGKNDSICALSLINETIFITYRPFLKVDDIAAVFEEIFEP